jgi:tetratricopeptide (TPR) repeat protein
MNKHHNFLEKTVTFIIIATIIASCSSGLQQLKKGNFDEAIFTSAERLQKSPDHKKALSVIREAYPLAIDDHKRAIRMFENSQEPFRWEKALSEYQALNRIYDVISHSSVSMREVGVPQSYTREAETARQLAADERYQAGELALEHKENRLAAKDAVGQFERVNQLIPNYKNAIQKAEEAFQYAIHRVVIEPVYDVYRLHDNDYFDLQKAFDDEFFRSKVNNQFVRYYTTAEARRDTFPQHDLVKFAFFDLRSPQRDITTTIEHFTKEIKVGTKKINDSTKVDVFEKVCAKITTYKKSVVVRGTMQMRVFDFKTNVLLNEETDDERYCWSDSWQVFEGNPKALAEGQTCPPTSAPMFDNEPSKAFFFNRISDQFANHFRRRLKKAYRNM